MLGDASKGAVLSVKQKVSAIVKKFDSHAKIDVYKSPMGNIHIVVVSERFDDMSHKMRGDLIWKSLEKQLTPSEALHITICLLFTPEEAARKKGKAAAS